MIGRALATIAAGALTGAVLARIQRAPKTITRSITTYTEHDIANIHSTPAPVEPAYWMNVMARSNTGVYTAYRRHGFTDEQAYDLMCIHIEGSYIQGGRK